MHFNPEVTTDKCKLKTAKLKLIKLQTCKSDTIMIDQAYGKS